jgi:hypothetical protein
MTTAGRTETFAALKSPARSGTFLLLALWLSPPHSGGVPSAGQHGMQLYPGPLCGGESGSTGRVTESTGRTAPFRQGRRGHGEGMDGRVEATRERLPDARRAPSGVAFSFTPGLRPSALRAGSAIRAAPAAQGLLVSWPRKGKVTRAA